MESLYGKHDDLRVYQLENEIMSLQPSNFETLSDFFKNFKHIVLLLKQCKVEKEDDQLILSILSKLEADYLVFVSTFHAGNLTTPGWKMPTLNAFIETLTNEHDKLVQMGIIRYSSDQSLHVLGPKDLKGKEKQQNNQKTKFDAPKHRVENQQHDESSGSRKNKGKGHHGKEKVKCSYCRKGFHPKHAYMKKKLDEETSLLERNHSNLPKIFRRRDQQDWEP